MHHSCSGVWWGTRCKGLGAQAPLVYLRIAHNNFTGPFPLTLAKLPKLAVLSMQSNGFTCAPWPLHSMRSASFRTWLRYVGSQCGKGGSENYSP